MGKREVLSRCFFFPLNIPCVRCPTFVSREKKSKAFFGQLRAKKNIQVKEMTHLLLCKQSASSNNWKSIAYRMVAFK